MQSHMVQARIVSKIRKILLITTIRAENAIFVVDITQPIMHVKRRGKCVGLYSARNQTILQGSIAATKNKNTIDEETVSFREAVNDQETIFLYAIDKRGGKDKILVPLTIKTSF